MAWITVACTLGYSINTSRNRQTIPNSLLRETETKTHFALPLLLLHLLLLWKEDDVLRPCLLRAYSSVAYDDDDDDDDDDNDVDIVSSIL